MRHRLEDMKDGPTVGGVGDSLASLDATGIQRRCRHGCF